GGRDTEDGGDRLRTCRLERFGRDDDPGGVTTAEAVGEGGVEPGERRTATSLKVPLSGSPLPGAHRARSGRRRSLSRAGGAPDRGGGGRRPWQRRRRSRSTSPGSSSRTGARVREGRRRPRAHGERTGAGARGRRRSSSGW